MWVQDPPPAPKYSNAVRTVERAIHEGHTEIVDADLSKYFGVPGQARRFQRVQLLPSKVKAPSHLESSLGLMAAREIVLNRVGSFSVRPFHGR